MYNVYMYTYLFIKNWLYRHGCILYVALKHTDQVTIHTA